MCRSLGPLLCTPRCACIRGALGKTTPYWRNERTTNGRSLCAHGLAVRAWTMMMSIGRPEAPRRHHHNYRVCRRSGDACYAARVHESSTLQHQEHHGKSNAYHCKVMVGWIMVWHYVELNIHRHICTLLVIYTEHEILLCEVICVLDYILTLFLFQPSDNGYHELHRLDHS